MIVLWMYISIMEWLGVIITIYALGGENHRFDFGKAAVCLLVNAAFYGVCRYFQLPSAITFLSYIFLFLYICWSYRGTIIRSLTILVISLMLVTVIELILTHIIFYVFPFEIKPGMLEIYASVPVVLVCFLLTRLKLYRLLGIMDKWEASYALVAILSLMIFTPVVMLRILKKLDVADYIYIALCIVVMWMLVSKIQKYNLENKIRKKYIDSFTEIIAQIRRRQHKVKNQFNTAFGLYAMYDTYDELVKKQKEFLGRLWDYELPTDAIILEDPVVVALLYEKINEAVERGIAVETVFSCSVMEHAVSDVIWVQILGTLLDNAIEELELYEGTKKLWIRIEKPDEDDSRISIQVINTCRPLKQEELEKMFGMGYSTKGQDRGIGLYDVKQLVYRYKGTLVPQIVEQEEGLCFEIRILM